MTNPRFSEEEARELWRRAAELHAAEQSRPSGGKLVPGQPKEVSFEDLAAAAEGAGIDPDLVRLAAAERRLPDAAEIQEDQWTSRWMRRIVAKSDAIDVVRDVPVPAPRLLEALETVATRAPYSLHLESRVGDDPVRDGVIVYRIVDKTSAFGGPMDFADARVLLFTVRPREDGARLRCRVPLFRRGINLAVSGVSTGMFGAGGLYAGSAAGTGLAALLGTASAALLLTPIGVGAVAGGALGMAGYRKLYDAMIRRALTALNLFLVAVATEADAGRRLPPSAG